MTEQPETEESQRASRAGERRGNDRRAIERRAPPPLWRRPWAYIGYGVVGGLALVLIFGGGRERVPATGPLETTTALPGVDTVGMPSARKPVLEANSVGDYERLLAQGESAAGQRVRTLLYCSPMRSVSLIAGSSISPSMASLADARGQVPGAECQWGTGPDAPDLFLLVPPNLAKDFAATREVEISFMRRRRVPAEIEWIGRSEALALRIVGVLQDVR